MKIKYLVIIALLCLPFITHAQQQWTLQQCVDSALANNRTVKQQALVKQTRDIAYKQARQNLLPDLNASASQNFRIGNSISQFLSDRYSTSFGISSSLLLFDGLKMKYNIDARKADVYASQADLDRIKQDIAVNVSTVYLQILMNKELLQIAKDQLALTVTKIEQRNAMVVGGKMAEGEVLELIAQQSKEEMNVLRADNTLKLSLLDLAQIIELDHFEDLDIVTPTNLDESDLVSLTAETVFESAVGHRPEIKGAEYKLKSSEYNVLSSKADYYPTLSVGAQSGTGYYYVGSMSKSFGTQVSDNLMTTVGFNLRIPIFNKFDVKNRVHTAQIAVESSKLEITSAKLELKKAIQQAYYNAVAAKSRWEAAQKSEVASKEAYRFANQKFEAGRATTYELYQAKNNLTQVISEEAQSKYEYFFRVKLLELYK